MERGPDIGRAFGSLTLLIVTIGFATEARANGSRVCLEPPYATTDETALRDIQALREAIAPFPSLLDSLEAGGPRFCWASGVQEALGTFDSETLTIEVNRALADGMRAAVLIHELRHMDQDRRGICPDDTLNMRAYARHVFALEADAMAIAHLVAWSALETGDTTIFNALSEAEETRDIAEAFAAEMGASGDPGLATSAAFDAWYASPARQERYYLSTCSGYLDRLDETHLLPGEAPLTLSFSADLCVLPDGAPYPCREPDAPLPR